MNNNRHTTDTINQPGWLVNHPTAYYLLSLLVGACFLSLLSLLQKIILGVQQTDIKGYIIPILFGGISGVLFAVWRLTQHQSQKHLYESNSLYRLLIEQASDGIFIADEQGNYADVNSSGCAMLGYTRAEILQMNIRDVLFTPELRENPLRIDKLQAGESFLMRRHLIRKDGALLFVEISGKELPGGRLQGIVRDITEREKVAAALREQEERLRTLIDASPDAIFFKDGDGRWLITNHMGLKLFGLEQVDYQGKTDLELAELSPFYREALIYCATTDEEAWANPPLSRSDETVPCPDGSSQVFDVIKVPLFYEDGRRKALVILGRDITERTKVATALEEQEERLRALINATPDIICFKDGAGAWLIANDADLELFGLEGVDYRGKTDRELADFSPFYREAFLTCKETDEVAWASAPLGRGDEIIPKPDGSQKMFDVIKVPLFYDDGRRKGLVVLGRDITERKMAEEALRQAQKTESLGVLAGGIAHDFNNLLVAMLGQTSLALAKLRPENPARPHIEKAVRATERAADLTRQMLAYSGRGHFETRAINLNHLIAENVHLFRAGLPKNVTWRTELTEPLPPIQADPGQMQQVIMNLIINGAQAVESSPGMVTVVTGVQEMEEGDGRYHHYTGQKLPPGSYVTLEVHDNGKGMDADMLPKIFDPFFTTKQSGRGLGLAAVLGIVRGHHGGLYVYSEPGKGTTFKLLFPIIKEQTAVAKPSEEKPNVPCGGTGVVLVIDDEEPVQDAVKDILALAGVEVFTASNGAAGLDLYRERMADIDLILLDLSMPEMNGEETYQRLRQINPQVRVILSSGYNQMEATRHFLGKGLAAFLQKPFNAENLIATVKQHLK
ncbi:MAG: PAS domain S-box protein [Anaerolineales bacterium]|nr:PAS domain S-box protein [Anaerolineales bacterium]MCB9005516.1 PAS domain S-box protein [Ardenticatenaceae bacterium]